MLLRNQNRRLWLFFAALIFPALLLVALSVRMLSQERELVEKRLVEEQRRAVGALRQELLARLEYLKLQTLNALVARTDKTAGIRTAQPAFMWVGLVEGEQLRLPWEQEPAAEVSLLSQTAFTQWVQQGEQTELVQNQPKQALPWYQRALQRAQHPAQTAYAQLLLARAYAKAGQAAEAQSLYQKLLAAPADLRDEQGIAFWLYAAERLALNGSTLPGVLERLSTTMEDWRTQPPTELYLRRDLAERLAAEAALQPRAAVLQRQTGFALRQMEQALALQNDWPGLLRLHTASLKAPTEPLWFPYGAELCLVSLTAIPGTTQSAALVVRAQELFATLETANSVAGRAELFHGDAEAGAALGANFPGLRVTFTNQTESAWLKRWQLQRGFAAAALLLVLSMAFFGTYLLWRDMRRELHLAELRSQFVASVSHELKTPLTAIRMFAETLRLGGALDARTQAEYLDTIVNESERLTRLLNNVLDFSQIEQGRKSYQLTPSDLAEIVRNAARALEYPLAQQGFTLRMEVEQSLPPVNADGDALQQALLNLLTNAMKYSGASREIALRLRRADNQALIEVEDWGLGIAPAEQERIFEKFYRAHLPETKHIPGAGLGLTLVAHIAQAHGARVAVRSVPGAGSTFSLSFPLEPVGG
jgi:signal transduction histidine kinase